MSRCKRNELESHFVFEDPNHFDLKIILFLFIAIAYDSLCTNIDCKK